MSVDFWFTKKGSKPEKRTQAACFYCINGVSDVDCVRYMAHIDPRLKKEDIVYYLSFLREWLDAKKWKEKFMSKTANATGGRIFFSLDSEGMKPHVRLLYLTAMRYVDEYPEIIEQLAKRTKPDEPLEKRFEEFQNIHNDAEARKFPVKMGCFAVHGLMTNGYYKLRANITLKQFAANLKTKGSVNATFEAAK